MFVAGVNSNTIINMSFEVESFAASPTLEVFNSLKKAELLLVAQHYKLSVTSSMGKGEVKKVVLSYLTEEELLSEEELESANASREDVLELKKLELQERDKSIQLKLRELEIRE